MSTTREARLQAWEQLHELGDELRRKVNPVTVDQIRACRENPDINIPDKMVGFERVPGVVACRNNNFKRTSDGRLVYALPGDRPHVFLVFMGECELSYLLMHDKSTCELIDIVRGLPLWIEQPVDKSKKCFLRLGDNLIADRPCIENVTVQQDGSIIFTHSKSGGMCSIGTWYNNELKSHRVSDRSFSGFLKETCGPQWVLHKFSCIHRYADMVSTLNKGQVTRYFSGDNLLGWVKDSAQMFVAYAADMSCVHVCEVVDEEPVLRSKAVIGRLPYLSSCQKLPDHHWAYIGQAAHKQQCWVVSGSRPRPAFNWVSELFEDPEHGTCYWGIIGDALVTMRL